MDIPGTRQPGRSCFPGRGRNQRPPPPLSPSSAAPQPEGAQGAWPLGGECSLFPVPDPLRPPPDPGPGAGLLQHGVTPPSLPPASAASAHASWLVPPARSPDAGTSGGPGQILEVLVGPQSSAICCLSLALALGTHTSSLARAGSARNHVLAGPWAPSGCPWCPAWPLFVWDKPRAFVLLPSGSTSSLRGETAKELWAQVPPAGGGGGRLSRLGREVHVSTRPASHPTALLNS